MLSREPDCLIVGAGPAGSMLALHLARRGLEVLLVDHGRAHYSGPFETVLGPTRAAWQQAGWLDQVADGCTPDPLRHGSIWGQPDVQWRLDRAEDQGLLLRRGAFDRALRAAARSAGAVVHEGVRTAITAQGVELDGIERSARCVAIATGRAQVAGLPAHRPAGCFDPGGLDPGCFDRRESDPGGEAATEPQTVAVTVVGEPAAQDRGTAIVEAVAQGWIWSHCPREGLASAALLMDSGASPRAAVADMLSAAAGPAGRLKSWRIRHAKQATPGLRTCRGESLPFLVGDAAASIDPLASQGVEKAVSAAEHAAVAIATSLERSEWAARLQRMHAQWERGVQQAHLRSALEFYAQEQRFAAAPFWRQRHAALAALLAQALPDEGAHLVAPEVANRPVLLRHGMAFVELDGARHAATGEELARIGRVPVAAVLALFDRPRRLAEAVAAARQDANLFLLTPHEVHQAILQLRQRGWLTAVHAAGSP